MYIRYTICKSCGEIIRTEKMKGNPRKPVYLIMGFCKECEEYIDVHDICQKLDSDIKKINANL